ncbi:Na(+)-translocating NADH-quinone reductase subunit A [Arundinibacter roseus]|uniref:Na(+)-translocating NADH-quinone reductase subunit A n=1 Tax=Arundinibacter roseus TaxID=2070510 RepID=A0A4R4K910_9BACT|nr:Na(+)-translocating NADH-quinone reductase subunit A [Arundinibacter roseus]TDB64178.1 Na(+)-translocating NADH-quinone reductase subunit A [Arundinibacter roseus]
MGKHITLKKGYNIKLIGVAEQRVTEVAMAEVIAVKPPDFPNLTPRLLVEAGDELQAGQPIFFDKDNPEIMFVSPVSGEVAEVVRGAKRRIMEVKIIPDRTEQSYLQREIQDPLSLSREQLIAQLLESGCWGYIRQRPFSLIANPKDTPKAIFVSCFDTAPLAPDLGFIIDSDPENFQTGLAALKQLANGNLHVSVPDEARAKSEEALFKNVSSDHIHVVRGPHPAGNVGVQIHHIDPIRKGDVVWYVHPQDVQIIGRLFREGRYRAERIVALTGSLVEAPQYYKVIAGQTLSSILTQKIKPDKARIIQGNVLTGLTSGADDFVSHYTNQITVIPEGDEPEFLGWLTPGLEKLSLSKAYFSWLFPKKSYALDTNMHGEERAFVMTGQYDKLLPMNILPVVLLKAILAQDIERMEQLGIYEIAEEDFALCEFACTSKIEVQRIISEGLDYVRREG